MIYALVRAVVRLAVNLFYHLRTQGPLPPAQGPVMFVSNHPNGLIDPALILLSSPRPVTFLGKAPLFRIPVLGSLARSMGALPVHRRQDQAAAAQMEQNEATLDAAAAALVDGRAIMIFPEGRSHSEPELLKLKTGAARILVRALGQQPWVDVIPVGLNYEAKEQFRSRADVEIGQPLRLAAAQLPAAPEERVPWLTARLAEGLRGVTVNLKKWDELPLLEVAESFYALHRAERLHDGARRVAFARGTALLREQAPEAFERLRARARMIHRHLALLHLEPKDVAVQYRWPQMASFVLRNFLGMLLGLPLFALGMVLFSVPFLLVRLLGNALSRNELDVRATMKLLLALAVAPAWWALGTMVFGWALGFWAGIAYAVGALPLALFTRAFLERRSTALHDVRVFFALGARRRLKERLLAEGEALAADLERMAERLTPASATAAAR